MPQLFSACAPPNPEGSVSEWMPKGNDAHTAHIKLLATIAGIHVASQRPRMSFEHLSSIAFRDM